MSAAEQSKTIIKKIGQKMFFIDDAPSH